MPKLSTLTISQLKEVLRAHDMTTTGNKPELISRLTEAFGIDEIDSSVLSNILPSDGKLQTQLDELKAMILHMAEAMPSSKTGNDGEEVAAQENVNRNSPIIPSGQTSGRSSPLTRRNSQQSELVTGLQTEIRTTSSRTHYSVKEIAETIPAYDPTNDESLSAEQFVHHVESALDAYKFEQKSLLLAVYSRFRGAAKLWLDGQTKMFTNWEHFKIELLAEFGLEMNEAEVNAKMASAIRKKDEKLVDYCFRMSALGMKFHLSEAAIIKYTRDGLRHSELQNAIATSRFTTLKELRLTVHEYLQNSKATTRQNLSKGSENRQIVKPDQSKSANVKCYNCHEIGHYSKDCPQSQRRARCATCQRTSHTTDSCPQKGRVRDVNTKVVNKIGESEDAYKEVVKPARLNGRYLRAFMDSGSSVSLIRRSKVVSSDVVADCHRVLTGFAGGKYTVKQQLTGQLELDGKAYTTDLFVVPDNDIPESLLIGRDILCGKGNRFVIGDDGCRVVTVSTKEIENDLSPNEHKSLQELLHSHKMCFATNLGELGSCSLEKLEIKLNTDQPINVKPYRVAFTKRGIIANIVEDLLNHDIIRPSSSQYASPVILVEKQNGEHRLCVDYRMLNKITVKTPFPMPILEEQFAQLANNKFFTSLDLRMGYHQIEVHETSKHLTAFVTTDGHYEFNRMPFGLVNAPAVFQRVMNRLIAQMAQGEALAYLDDVIIPSKTVSEGLQRLEKFLKVLRRYGLTLRYDKCQFFRSEITHLGHIISSSGIKPGLRKVNAIQNFAVPKTTTEVRRFMGLTGFFRKFVADYALISKPITKLLRKDCVHFQWCAEQQEAFDTLIKKLTNAPILELYDMNKMHEVHTDACSVGLAGVLLQSEEGKAWRPVMYFSRHCTDAENKYHSYELEVLAIVETLERFRIYLLGKHFRLVTDCSAIALTKEQRELKPRISRWWLKMQEFDYNIQHRPANRLAHVDAMSRTPYENACPVEPAGFLYTLDEMDWISALQNRDERIKTIVDVITKRIKSAEETQLRRNFVIINHRLYRKQDNEKKLVVPKLVRLGLVRQAVNNTNSDARGRAVNNTNSDANASYAD